MIRNLQDSNRVNMTSFWGDTIYASASEICNKLGVKIACYDGDKTHFEFELETEDGIPFTLYDWKEGDWVTEDTPLLEGGRLGDGGYTPLLPYRGTQRGGEQEGTARTHRKRF